MNEIQQSFADSGLVRVRRGRLLGGVCTGLGQRFGMGAWTSRLLFVLILMIVPGLSIVIYPILWILMPSEAMLHRTVASPPHHPHPPVSPA